MMIEFLIDILLFFSKVIGGCILGIILAAALIPIAERILDDD